MLLPLEANYGFSESRHTLISTTTKFIFLFGILIFGGNLNAQNLTHESQLIEYLGQEDYNEFTQSNPSYLAFLDARYDGYMIMDYVEEKMGEFETIEIIYKSEWVSVEENGKIYIERVKSKITPEEFLAEMGSQEFNFLEYSFKFDRSIFTYHVLGTTGKVIMIYPVEKINEIVNRNTGSDD